MNFFMNCFAWMGSGGLFPFPLFFCFFAFLADERTCGVLLLLSLAIPYSFYYTALPVSCPSPKAYSSGTFTKTHTPLLHHTIRLRLNAIVWCKVVVFFCFFTLRAVICHSTHAHGKGSPNCFVNPATMCVCLCLCVCMCEGVLLLRFVTQTNRTYVAGNAGKAEACTNWSLLMSN